MVSVLSLHLHLCGCFNSEVIRRKLRSEKKWRLKIEKSRREWANRHFTNIALCSLHLLFAWWMSSEIDDVEHSCWALSPQSDNPKRITYHLSLCEGDLWWIWRTYEWSVKKKNGLNGERLHMGCKFTRNRKTIHNMHECQREKCSVFTHWHKLVGLHPLVCVWVYDVELAGGLGLVYWGWDVAGTHCLSGWVCEYKGITAYGLAHWQLWLCVCL